MISKVMLKDKIDEVMDQIKLPMTPERQARLRKAASEVAPMVRRLTESPAEAMALLHLMLEALSKEHGVSYRGTILVQDREVPESTCYGCGAKFDRAAEPGGSDPEPGDCTICSYCGAVHVFDDELTAVKPSEQRLAELMAMPHIAVMAKSAKAIRDAK